MTPEDLRRLLADYDAGLLTETEVSGVVFRRTVEQVVDSVRRGEAVIGLMSWCASAPPSPLTTLRVRISINEAEIRIERCL